MRISDWSSDVCSSDLPLGAAAGLRQPPRDVALVERGEEEQHAGGEARADLGQRTGHRLGLRGGQAMEQRLLDAIEARPGGGRSEEHTSELQSLMRISYAVFCLKKQKQNTQTQK